MRPKRKKANDPSILMKRKKSTNVSVESAENVVPDLSDDDLPSVQELFKTDDNVYRVDDIVWAKWKAWYWPAIVMKLNVKTKKVGLLFVDATNERQCYWTRICNVTHYGRIESAKLEHQEISDADLNAKFQRAVEVTDDFLRKRCLSKKKIKPMDFFRSPILYCIEQYLNSREKSENTTGDVSVTSSSESTSGESVSKESVSGVDLTSNGDCDDDEGDDDEGDDEEGEGDDEEGEGDNDVQAKQLQQLSKAHVAKLDELMEVIQGINCKEHLFAILSGTLANKRHRLFFSRLASVRRDLKFSSGFGPFGDYDEYVKVLYSHLMDLLKEKMSTLSYHLDPISYIFDVWIPEAIHFAYQEVFGVTDEVAEEIFLRRKSIIEIMQSY